MAGKIDIKSGSYTPNAARNCSDIITDSLIEVLEELYIIAGRNMGASIDTSIIRREASDMATLLKRDFAFLPLYKVVEAFYHGSLGSYGGTTRLTLRNIATWLREVNDRHKQYLDLQKKLVKNNEPKQAGDSIAASAMRLKMTWRMNGRISGDEWDSYPLEKIAAIISTGKSVELIKPQDVRI